MDSRKKTIKRQIDAFTESFQSCRSWRLSELTVTELSLLLDRLESLGEHITTIEASFGIQMSSFNAQFGVNSSSGKKMDLDEECDGEQLFSSEFKYELENTKSLVKQQIDALTSFQKNKTLNKGISESEVLAASLVSQVSQHTTNKKKETRGRKKGSTAAKLNERRRMLERQDSVSSVDSTSSRSSTKSNSSRASNRSSKSKGKKAGKISKKNGNTDIDMLTGEDMCGNHPDRCCACGTRIYIKGRSHWTHDCSCKHNFHLKCVSRSDFPFSSTVCPHCKAHAPLVKVVRPPGGAKAQQSSSALSARGKIQKLVSVDYY